MKPLVKLASKLQNSEFVGTLKSAIERKIGNIKMSEQTASKLRSGAQQAGEAANGFQNLLQEVMRRVVGKQFSK